ncbi:MAG: hypothetical protein CM15mP74_16390 [Halieaceae bacterium]|nr:MAG: hypothetical protein CM15mP74_16390 [Halieaceae bacterium]
MGIPREAKRFRGLRQIGMLTPVLIDEAREVGSSFCMAEESRRYPTPLSILLCTVLIAAWSDFASSAGETSPPAVTADNLLRETIDGIEGKEVIVSRVSFPRIELPWHWHPGEEFFYVIEGSVTLKRRGQPDVVTVRGDSQKIAPGVIHSGESGKEGAELVIFRVHASGETERYLVD